MENLNRSLLSQIKSNNRLKTFFSDLSRSRNEVHCDIAIIGGGIIGTAVAKTLKENIPSSDILLVEKENELALHQSGNNSGVIHAGIYYPTDSLKAKLCVQGLHLIYEYCNHKNITYKKNGKLIVATNKTEVNTLGTLLERGRQNNVPDLKILQGKSIRKIQPNCTGLAALWSPHTGNIDWNVVTKSFGNDFLMNGGKIFFNCKVNDVRDSKLSCYPVVVKSDLKDIYSKYVIFCGGLYTEYLLGTKLDIYKAFIVKVNFKKLHPQAAKMIKTNLYAVPDINSPFLGVHLCKGVTGDASLLLNAIPVLKLDYQTEENNFDYAKAVFCHRAFHMMIIKHFFKCAGEVIKTYCPNNFTQFVSLHSKDDLLPGPTAIQVQMINRNGNFVQDFLIDIFDGEGINRRIINCKFLPSPGATSSLAIAQMITNKMKNVDF